ncbi:ABC transporter ATP-binding protein [Rathayibacter sp. VKM Ac-2760]|uniref:ABC transporter ATP-binding protein n=1 Tax=Rathayibacter sp. VKM Ac-2760 TaxID=2609253 RepID=UPI0013190C63|nr:ABC transporter ATP-binding protein [Rathayibacter sp. VKM Ac-2760]QHC57273.1 ATP-binding cassette domain-containing protein [Rathayibacter sp. VKM Ac-2760]
MQNQTSSVVARVEGVRKLYGSTPPVVALDDVSLSIERGEFTAVMGPSGSGKSTLMHVLAGLDTASAGRVFLGDVEITAMGDAELTVLRRRSVGFVFQAFNLVPTLDVRGNIRLPFELDGRRVTAEEEQWIARLIESLGLRERLTHRPHELSGGQQQRVAIARALATRPQLIFADEPTGNLDSRTGREVLSLLRASTREYGQSIAMVTHDPIAAAFADRIVFLRDGAVVDDRRGMSAEEISRAMLSMEGAS